MALFGLFSALLGTFLSFCPLLYECKMLDGYKFPVYSTQLCPRNQTEWNERSSAINCTKDNGYLCFPNEKFTQLLEFCHTARFIWIQEGYCLYLKKDDSTIYSYSCSSFQSGCHNSSFPSYDLFKHPSCTSIGNGCFLAEPSCKGIDTTTQPPETTKSIHVEVVSRDANKTLKKNDSANNDKVIMVPILYGVFISISFFCMACIIYRKGNQLCKGHDDEEYHTGKALQPSPLLPTDKRDIAVLVKSELPLDRVIFEQWEEDDRKFVSTRACKEVEKLIKSQNLVVVTGNSGSGKSAIIQHIALSYRDQKWTVKPIFKVKEIIDACSSVDVLQNRILFVYSDPIGIESFDVIAYDSWRIQEVRLSDCLKSNKILLSCRNYILYNPRVKGILKDESCIIDISNVQLKLNNEEKQEIWTSQSSNKNLSKEECYAIAETEEYFPLLCKMFSGGLTDQKEKLRFFKEPVGEFKEKITYFRLNSIEIYCTLVLLAVFDGVPCVGEIEQNEKAIEKIELALDRCGLTNTQPFKITETLKTLEGFLVKKIGDHYQFHNNFVMEVTTYMIGKDYPALTIEYADIGFIRRRVKLHFSEDKSDQFTIYLSDRNISILAKRLVNEIVGDRLLDVVLNPCLKSKNLIKKIIEELQNHPLKLKMFLQKKELELENNRYQETENIFVSKLAFLALEKRISSLYALNVFCHTQISLHCLKELEKTPENVKDMHMFSSVCCNGSLDLLKQFSENQMKGFLTQKWGHLYPVHIVSVFHNYKILRKLIELGVDVNLKDSCSKSGFSPLIYAAGNDTTENDDYTKQSLSETRRNETVKLLLKHEANVNLCSTDGSSPLSSACFGGYNSTVQLLLKHNANVNQLKEDGTSPLNIASANRHYSTVELLLSEGADVNLCDINGVSPLFIACQNGDDSTAQVLLSKGADINLCNSKNLSPLFVACQNGHYNTVQVLLKNSAHIYLSKTKGEDPIIVASENGHNSIVQLLLNFEAGRAKSDALSFACLNGHVYIVNFLLNNGANVNYSIGDGITPLHIACDKGYNKIVQLLLSNGADINSPDKNGVSPTSVACYKGHDCIVQDLLQRGANINVLKKNEPSPLFMSCYAGHESTVKLLLSNGAEINSCTNNEICPTQSGQERSKDQKLSDGSVIEQIIENGVSSLYIAFVRRHYRTVQVLLDCNADTSIIDGFGLNSVPKDWYDITGQFLLRKNNIIENIHDLDSYFSLFIFCQVEQFSRSSRLLDTMVSICHRR